MEDSVPETKGERCYWLAFANLKETGSPRWGSVGEAVGARTSTAIGLARKWATRPENRVDWPLKAGRRNEKRYRAGAEIYRKLREDPTCPMRFLGGKPAERSLYYFVKTEGPKPEDFIWPIPERVNNKGTVSGRVRLAGTDRMELGAQVYSRLRLNPHQTLDQLAEALGYSRNKINNDLALYVKAKRQDPEFLWPIPGRRKKSAA